MGYFPRKLDRARARQETRDPHDFAAFSRPWEKIPGEAPPAGRFVRFAAHEHNESSGRRTGIFQAAYGALRRAEIEPALVERLRRDLDWFNVHLHAPTFDEPRAVFLFKSSATECMRQIWSLVHSLRDADIWVEMQTVENPGRVVFEDELQIAVVPWADTASI